jgi:hypothetical protein
MGITKGQLIGAAVAGLLSASTLAHSSAALAADDTAGEKGHCVGANACQGKGGCAQVGKNECSGKNGCKGKGFVEKTKAECDAMAKKNKNIKFETAMSK